MSTMIRNARPQVKAHRRTARPDGRFGAGLLAFVPFAVVPFDHFEPSAEERAEAALLFADDAEPDAELDRQAAEAAAVDSMSALTPPAGICRSCGEFAEDLDELGRCDRCDREGTGATIAGVNRRFGLGNRVS